MCSRKEKVHLVNMAMITSQCAMKRADFEGRIFGWGIDWIDWTFTIITVLPHAQHE